MLPPTDMAVLGAAFHGHVVEIDRSGFQPEWMESPISRAVLSAMFSLSRQNKVINPLNIMAIARGVPKEAWQAIIDLGRNRDGDVDWLQAVTGSRERYMSRQLTKLNEQMAVSMHDARLRPSEWLPGFAHQINSLLDTGKTSEADPVSLFEKKIPSVLWKSWIPAFNNLLGGGYRDGMLCIYAGCTGHGKSTVLITHTADCVMQGRRVDVIVNELMPEMFLKRVLRATSGLTEREIELKRGDDAERDAALKDWLAYLQRHLRVYNQEMYNARMMERVVRWDDAEALVVDYIRGVNIDGNNRGSDPAGDMAYSMLDLYRSARIPILSAGQMSDSNSKSFIKRDDAPPAIIYGSARCQQASSAYNGTKRDSIATNWQYFRGWKNTFTGRIDIEERIRFIPETGAYEIPIPTPSLRGRQPDYETQAS